MISARKGYPPLSAGQMRLGFVSRVIARFMLPMLSRDATLELFSVILVAPGRLHYAASQTTFLFASRVESMVMKLMIAGLSIASQVVLLQQSLPIYGALI